MNPCVFIIFSLLLLRLNTTTSNELVAVGVGGRGGDHSGVINNCFDKERHALLLFKARLQDPDGRLSTWRDDNHNCCKWRGVTCNNQTSRVTELDISIYNLAGQISDSLLKLSDLNHLDISYNRFNGTIPPFIGSMTRLKYLHLGNNYFNGTIPWSIGLLTELRHLYLFQNSLDGTIPPDLGNLTNLRWLDLGFVGRCKVENLEWLSHLSHLEELLMDGISLVKANHWVDVIMSLRNLSFLSLTRCELSQVMHPYSSFPNSSSSIHTLFLGNNNLNSSMYPWLSQLTTNKLHFLHLSNNMLDGIPKYFGNLCSLEWLEFDNNSAVVKFPDFLNNLSGCTSLTLQTLYASASRFTGSLSDDIQKFSSLVALDLSGNQLISTISDQLLELPTLSNVDYIDLSSCKLGPRFPRWIQTLKNVTSLNIANTSISDTIPLEFWYMWPNQLRYLNFSSNNISGEVPDLSSIFDNHSVIDMSSNKLYGSIPNVSSTLSSLNLSKNKISGGISFLCKMLDGFLKFLDLSDNFLSGQLPDCLWHFKEIKVLNLGNNNLSGKVPDSIESLIKLEALYLYKNNFSGELPLSLKNCTSLNSLNLRANKFSGNVPDWIGENLSSLYVLILRSNNFLGTIPLQLCQLANLQILDLSINHLHGTIPSCLDNLTSMVQQRFLPVQNMHFFSVPMYRAGLATYLYIDHASIQWQGNEREFFDTLILLKSIDLSSNNLTGQIPHELANLIELVTLNLSKNAMYGDIPPKIGEMKKLLTLDLSRNSFSGPMPSSMSQMTLLNDLDVSFNNLAGRIPSSTQLQSFEPSRYDGNEGLCGPPLTEKCNEDEEVPSLVDESDGDGEGIDELEKWFYIGGVTGFATGFWIAFGALLVNHRGRHAFFHYYDSFKDLIYVK